MSADHLEFLKSKFMEDLRDAEEEHTRENEIPLHSHFLQIRDVLKDKSFTLSTPIRTKDCLYNAIGALEECVILSEKREPRKKDGPLHGYTLVELLLLCRTKKLLLKITKMLVNTREDAVESSPASTSDIAAARSSSFSLPVLIPRPEGLDENSVREEIVGFDEQEKEIRDELVDEKKWGKGFKKIGIVGIGGSGKTSLAQLVFTNRKVVNFFHYRIWICLSQTLTSRDGDVDLKAMVRDMLEQCGVQQDKDEDVDEDDLLENLKNVLMGGNKSYLIVFDGIWDIKMDWYLKLGDKLEWFDNDKVKERERESESSGGVIITTRLPHIPKQMGMHLHHMAPPSPEILEYILLKPGFVESYFLTYKVSREMKDETIEQCDGLPLAVEILSKIITKQMFGERYEILSDSDFVAMVNSKDDAILGKDLFLWLDNIAVGEEDKVVDVSELPLLDVLEIVNAHFIVDLHRYKRRLKVLVVSGDAKSNRLLQLISNFKIDPKPPIAMMSLGSQTDFSLSLGWKNQIPSHPNITNVAHLLQNVYTAEERIIDSWDFLLRMTMIPNSLQEAFSYPSTSEADLTHMGGYKEFRTTFWSYFIIGMDDREWFDSSYHGKKDEGFTNSCCKSRPRIDALAISIKIKDQQGQWKEINIPHSIKSIVCLNLPCFLGEVDPWERSNVKKKKERNFTPSFVDDGLFEVIGFRDYWHGRGTRLAQVDRIRFDLYKAAANHIYMSIDGNRWKQPLPIDDDSFLIEISHLRTTKMLMTSDSKCKFKKQPLPSSPKIVELSKNELSENELSENELSENELSEND